MKPLQVIRFRSKLVKIKVELYGRQDQFRFGFRIELMIKGEEIIWFIGDFLRMMVVRDAV